MQTLGPSDQRAGSQQSQTRSATSNSLHPPATPSSSIFTSSSLSTATSQRTPRYPDTISEFAASDTLLGPSPFGNSTFYGPDSREPSPQRPAFSSGSASPEARRQKSLVRKASLVDLPLHSWQQQQHQQAHSPPPVSRFKSLRRRAKSTNNLRGNNLPAHIGASIGIGGQQCTAPPEFALPSASKLSSSTRSSGDNDSVPPTPWSRANSIAMESGRMLSRQGTMPSNGSLSASGGMMPPPSAMGMQSEATMVHQHIQEMANKRISTLEYLRKAHEGRVYWFNTLLFDKPDLARMPYFDTRRLARRATNYLLLGLSLPTVIDLAATSPTEFLRSLNLLLTEFDAFQSLHPEIGSSASGLGRARIPNLNVFRRATPSAKSRRSSSANNDALYEDGAPAMPNGAAGGGGGGSISNISSNAGGSMSIMNGLGGSASVVSFGQSEADLLPGEEYVHLLTPSLPFDPDFFETFATLCDVLIDAYTRLLGMLPTPRECNASVAELFTKADAKVRKIIVQGIVKEFEDTSRNGVRTEVANVGKIVLGGLM